MKKTIIYYNLLLTLFLLLASPNLRSQQTYPIYVTPSLTPPYSLTLSDYSQIGSQRLVVTIMVKDVTVTNLPVRLNIRIETMTGVTIETIPTAPVMPVFLSGGEVNVLFGDDLRDYFDIRNLQFKGYSKDEYRRTGQLPEGFYRFTVEVHHATTGRLISNQGTAMAWIALGKPPALKTPDNNAELGQIAGMPLTFSWLPSNVGTPNNGIQYTFEMWEMRIPGIDANVVAASMPVFYSTTQMNTSLVVYPAALMFEPGMSYAWRVTASDMMGQVPFAQDGRSEVRKFTYQCRCDSVNNFNVERQGQDVTYRWTPSVNNTSFNVELNNPITGWSKTERVYDAKFEFKSDTAKTYRARVQAICQGNEMNPSDFTSWQTVSVPAPKNPIEDCPNCECGDSGSEPPVTNFTLRTDLKPGDTIQTRSGRSTFIIKSVAPQGDGIYKGQFLSWVKIWGVKFLCDYWDLKVNTDNKIVDMNFESVYDPQFFVDVDSIKDFLNQLDDAVKDLISGGSNPNIIELDFVIPENPEATYNDSTGVLTIVDSEGNEHQIESDTMPVTIQDKSGTTYQIDEKGNITEVSFENYEDNRTQESKTQIEDGDTSLYIALDETNVYQDSSDKTKKSSYYRYYENNETIILPPGKYTFKAIRKFVNVKETDNLTYDQSQMANSPIVTKDIKDLELLNQTTFTKESGDNNTDFNTRPYLWMINTTKYGDEEKGANNIDYTLNNKGNYAISIQTRTAPFPKAKVVTAETTTSKAKVEHGGWVEVEGIADAFKLNIMILDPEPVYFTRADNYKGEYGFDNFEKTELRNEYYDLEIKKVNGEIIKYAIPYLSVQPNKPYSIFASVNVSKDYMKGIPKDKSAYTFSSTDININGNTTYNIDVKNLKEGANKISLTIQCNSTSGYDSPKLVTVTDVTGKIVGQMKVYCMNVDKSEPVNLVKVYLGENDNLNNAKSAETLMSEALQFLNNRAYNQAFVEFEKDKVEELRISDDILRKYLEEQNISYEEIFNSQGEIQFQKASPELDVIIKVMEKDNRFSSWQGKKTIIVLANRNKAVVANERTAGYNCVNDAKKYYYDVILNSGSNDYTTYTHELGHLLGLKHPFPDTNSDGTPEIHPKPDIMKGTSRNFMDYSSTTDMFWTWQWKILRDNTGLQSGDNNEQNQQNK